MVILYHSKSLLIYEKKLSFKSRIKTIKLTKTTCTVRFVLNK